MAEVKKGDFIEIDYTGKDVENDAVFDTTVAAEAAKHGMTQGRFKPLTICVGEGQLLAGLDKGLEGKAVGEQCTIVLEPEDAFGKKSAKMIQLISTNKFKKKNINPFPGLEIDVDGMKGIVKTVTGGRTMVDFNHPLSGREVLYVVDIKRVVTDTLEKAKSLTSFLLGEAMKVDFKEGKLTVSYATELPDEFAQKMEEQFKKTIPEVKEVTFTVEKASAPEANTA